MQGIKLPVYIKDEVQISFININFTKNRKNEIVSQGIMV